MSSPFAHNPKYHKPADHVPAQMQAHDALDDSRDATMDLGDRLMRATRTERTTHPDPEVTPGAGSRIKQSFEMGYLEAGDFIGNLKAKRKR